MPQSRSDLSSRSRSKTGQRAPAIRAGRLVLIASVLGAPLAAVPPLVGTAAAETHQVSIQGLQFVPGEMSASMGDEIVWTSHDPDTHGVTGGPMNSPDLHQNDTFKWTVSQPGDISYGCRFHPSMHGVIKVAGGGGSAPPPAPSAPVPAPAPPPAPGGVPDIGALLAQLLSGLLGGVPHSVPGAPPGGVH